MLPLGLRLKLSAEKNKRLDLFLDEQAQEDIAFWKSNAQVSKRIVAIIEDCRRTPFHGIGKPEPLKYALSGKWSRRINREHRVVYCVELNTVFVLSCRFHYSKKK